MRDDATVLNGLDGSNPLGFLAALGLLRIADDHSPLGSEQPKLSWVDRGQWVAALEAAGDVEALTDLVLRDLESFRDAAVWSLAYDDDGRPTAAGPGAVRDLKPLPATLRSHHENIAARLANATLERRSARRSADLAAAFGSELVVDNKGRVKPTALHFTAGQQSFLSMAIDLAAGVRREHVVEALAGPWTNTSALPSFSWNAFAARNYALRASNPAKEKRGSNPGAEWLAIIGLADFPVVSRGQRLHTTCVRGGWKTAAMTWPLWETPLTQSVVASLLTRQDLPSMTLASRDTYGVVAVLRSAILRSEQGGYGSFTPAALT